jgi:hypothetical protein
MLNNKRGQRPTIFPPKNRKGLSTIIVTVILIGLTIVAVGIVWAVVNNTLKKGAESTDISSKCLGIQLTASAVSCSGGTSTTAGTCTVQLSRTGTDSSVISGVKVVAVNSTGTRSTFKDSPNNLPVAEGRTVIVDTPIGMVSASVNEIESTVYFTDTAGRTQYCPQPNVFTF